MPDSPRQHRGFLIAAAVLAVAAIALSIWSAGQYRDARAFGSAPLCAADARSYGNCRLPVAATVADITITNGKHSFYAMRISGSDGVSGTYTFPDEADVLDSSNVGDTVVAEVWHGKVVAISDDASRSLTGNAPLYQFRQTSTTALTLLLFALVLFLSYAWDIRSIERGSIVTTLTGWRDSAYLMLSVAAVAALVTAVTEWVVPDAPIRWVFLGTFGLIGAITIPRYLIAVRRRTRPFRPERVTAWRLAGRRRPPWLRITGGIVAVLLIGGAMTAGIAYGRAEGAAADFRNARRCPTFGIPAAGCIAGTQMSVDHKRVVDGGQAQRSIWVYDLGVGDQQVDFPDSARAFVTAIPIDDYVTVWTWHGRVVTVTWNGTSEATSDNPGRSHSGDLVIAILLAAFAVLIAVWIASASLRRGLVVPKLRRGGRAVSRPSQSVDR